LRLAPLGTGCDLKEPDPGPVQSYWYLSKTPGVYPAGHFLKNETLHPPSKLTKPRPQFIPFNLNIWNTQNWLFLKVPTQGLSTYEKQNHINRSDGYLESNTHPTLVQTNICEWISVTKLRQNLGFPWNKWTTEFVRNKQKFPNKNWTISAKDHSENG
jgi:hypothetical protein